MTWLVQDLEQSIALVLLIKIAMRVVRVPSWRDRPGPVPFAALGLFALVAIPTAAQAVWHPVLGALMRDPHQITAHHEYWRLLTSMTVQDGGVPGAVFNLVTLAIVGTLAAWFWGGRRTVASFVSLGIAFNAINVLSGAQAVGAGSSGATFGLAATMAGYAVVRGDTKLRAAAAAALGFGGVIWAAGNIHGMAVVAGGALGIALALAGSTRRVPRPERPRLAPRSRLAAGH